MKSGGVYFFYPHLQRPAWGELQNVTSNTLGEGYLPMVFANEAYFRYTCPTSHSFLCLYTYKALLCTTYLTRVILYCIRKDLRLTTLNSLLLTTQGTCCRRFPLYIFTLGGLAVIFSNGFVVFLLWRRGEVSNPHAFTCICFQGRV